jgi:hypothetical protein
MTKGKDLTSFTDYPKTLKCRLILLRSLHYVAEASRRAVMRMIVAELLEVVSLLSLQTCFTLRAYACTVYLRKPIPQPGRLFKIIQKPRI